MNKYLTKVALTLDVNSKGKPVGFYHKGSSIDNAASVSKQINLSPRDVKSLKRVGKVGLAIAATGAAAYGVKKMTEKRANAMSKSTKKDLEHTATIGAIGLGTSTLGAKISKSFPKAIGSNIWKAGAIGGALGLAGDYAAVKINKNMTKKSEDMSNKYLEKIALSETIKGLVSPAWQQHSIAKKHGKTTNGAGELYGTEVGGAARKATRAAVTGVAGVGLGALAGAALGSRLSAPARELAMRVGAGVGGFAGSIHGGVKSSQNQAKEMNKRYKGNN